MSLAKNHIVNMKNEWKFYLVTKKRTYKHSRPAEELNLYLQEESKISYYYTQIYLKMLCAVQDLISQDHNAASIEVRKRSHRKI